jgi:hypothetical protein
MIVDPAISEIERRVPEVAMEWLPRLEGRSIDGNGTPTAMVRMIAIVGIVFQAVEGGQHLRERPALAAPLLPEIEIFGMPRMAARVLIAELPPTPVHACTHRVLARWFSAP